MIYKCIQGKAPRAWNAIFVEKRDASLTFKAWFQDERAETDSGYVATAPGDSGSPIWIENNDINGVITRTIIAVLEGGHDSNHFSTNIRRQCRDYATKVSEEVVDWIVAETELA